jgi:hypothetical protein
MPRRPNLRYTKVVHLGAFRVGVASAALCHFVSTRALAQPLPRPFEVSGTSSCPAPELVRAEIFQLSSAERRRAIPADSRVTLSDNGASYRVAVTTDSTRAEKTYDDPARDCARRARFAAVFAVLTLMPPQLADLVETESKPGAPPDSTKPAAGDTAHAPGSSGKAPPAPLPNPSAQLPNIHESEPTTRPIGSKSEAPRRLNVLRLEARGRLELGFSTSKGSPTPSAGAELSLMRLRPVTPVLAFAYSSPAELGVIDARVRFQRVEALIGARAGHEFGIAAPAAELALVALVERARARELTHPESARSLSFGLRAAALLALWRTGPIFGLHAALFPAPTAIEALPRGTVGHLPYLWLGVSAGIGLGL